MTRTYIVWREDEPHMLKAFQSRFAAWAYGLWIGLRSFIAYQPSRVVTMEVDHP